MPLQKFIDQYAKKNGVSPYTLETQEKARREYLQTRPTLAKYREVFKSYFPMSSKSLDEEISRWKRVEHHDDLDLTTSTTDVGKWIEALNIIGQEHHRMRRDSDPYMAYGEVRQLEAIPEMAEAKHEEKAEAQQNKILNPTTGRMVSRTGAVGRQLVKEEQERGRMQMEDINVGRRKPAIKPQPLSRQASAEAEFGFDWYKKQAQPKIAPVSRQGSASSEGGFDWWNVEEPKEEKGGAEEKKGTGTKARKKPVKKSTKSNRGRRKK